jgi:hypothetical protein
MFMCGAKGMRGERRGRPVFIPPGSGFGSVAAGGPIPMATAALRGLLSRPRESRIVQAYCKVQGGEAPAHRGGECSPGSRRRHRIRGESPDWFRGGNTEQSGGDVAVLLGGRRMSWQGGTHNPAPKIAGLVGAAAGWQAGPARWWIRAWARLVGPRRAGLAEGESAQAEAAPFFIYFLLIHFFIIAFIYNLSLGFEIQAPI